MDPFIIRLLDARNLLAGIREIYDAGLEDSKHCNDRRKFKIPSKSVKWGSEGGGVSIYN